MSKWNNATSWAALVDGSACPICRRGEPLDVIASLEASWLTMPEAAPVKGYVCLVSRSHVVEPHELEESQAQAFWRDVRRVSRALSVATEAIKLNYEIHGNSLPHLHMHFFPRYRGDQFEGRPIDPKAATQPMYARDEFQALRAKIVNEC